MTRPADPSALLDLAVRCGLLAEPQAASCRAVLSNVAAPLAWLVQQKYLAPDEAKLLAQRLQESTTSSTMETPRPEESRRPARVGPYEITGVLGQGGMGVVYSARDTRLDRDVAIKVLRGPVEARDLERFHREAKMIANLHHPGIVNLYDVGEENGTAFYAMPLIRGRSLATAELPRRQAVALMQGVAEAVHFAHEAGVYHRDIKPENILIDENGRGILTDFGLAKRLDVKGTVTASGMLLGTPAFMSPEQARGDSKRVDRRTDVWGLGATLYRALTGRLPFVASTPVEVLKEILDSEPRSLRAIDPKIHPDLETICLKALEKTPGRRYSTAHEFALDLRHWLDGEPIAARPPSTAHRFAKFLSKRKSVIGIALTGLTAITLTAAILVPKWRAEKAERTKKEGALADEQAARLREANRRERARPLLEEGWKRVARMDALLTTEDWRFENLRALGEQARGEFDKALFEDPNCAEALLGMARTYRMEGARARAVEYASRAIDLNRGFASANLERALLNAERYEEIRHDTSGWGKAETEEMRVLREDLERDLVAVRSGSRDPMELAYAEGMILFADGRFEEAAERLQEYAQRALSDPAGWKWAGHAWLHVRGKAGPAASALTQSLKYRPVDRDTWGLRGAARLEQGDNSGAIADYTKAIQIDPRCAVAYSSRGRAYAAKDDFAASIRDFTEAIEIDPRDPKAYSNRSIPRLRSGDLDGAIQDCTKAIDLAPRYAEAYSKRGAARADKGDFEGAIRDFTQAIEIDPALAEAYVNRGTERQRRGDLGGAITDYAKAIEIEPRLAEAFFNRGFARGAKWDLDGAIQDYTKAIEIRPKYARAYCNRGLARADKGDLDGAIQDYAKAIEIDPRLPEAYYNLGAAHEALAARRPARARDHLDASATQFERALEVASPDAPSHAAAKSALRRVREALAKGP